MDQQPFIVVDKRGTKRSEEPEGTAWLTEAEADELLAQQAAGDDSDPIAGKGQRVLTAFLVTIDYEGNVLATNQIDMDLEVGRPAGFSDMYGAAAIIQKDISNQEASMRVLATLHSQVAQAREMQSTQKIVDRLRIR